MKKLVFLLFIVLAGTIYYIEAMIYTEQDEVLEEKTKEETEAQETIAWDGEADEAEEEEPMLVPEGTIDGIYLGMTSEELVDLVGEPTRRDPSAYGYDWWIYPMQEGQYMQVGVEDEAVVTLLLTGSDLGLEKLELGASYDDLGHQFTFENRVNFEANGQSYQFELSDSDVKMRPLVEYSNGYAVLYFDTFEDTLSSIRFLDGETLLLERPYSIIYRGELPEYEVPSPEIQKRIEQGNAQQIFDITNVIRHRHDLPAYEWDEAAANVAYMHSRDMAENEYFSHTSPTTGELRDRFEDENILFRMLGENIAAHYVDGAAAVEGWLNSEGHRVPLLSDEFTHLGVGVFEKYYTQNFLVPWDEHLRH
ncbi:CAP domain-containing protein [Halalkalibacterium halodurans]|uniref:BH2604 protein n=1 Tax=Halalkalibacterium halodurans (strain ATCC BAA-125 / DSM 18197 / FERM 7344 / JCM 9153 / C-125) TaxID=272558 RepID=Q9K9P1_HALH5|nr:CAP domain-containing protein [Halalkalibacterium halodurans]MED4173458.1 CAP domain-containing protein [Halalkalibacterium halodurans]BAB06323.1 BH2604 [Halalkalibacterium halodurans C-125]